jgi:DNA-binding beta-propeller fold protein YncE
MWGYFGQAETPEALWGPRDILVDDSGRVFVSDTGNKRIVVFDIDGNPIAQYGSAGLDVGQFDEPTGLAMSSEGILYVADTWNQRIQSFLFASDNSFQPFKNWDVAGWYGQSLDNKPYMAVGANGHLFASDPESYRILEFTPTGEIVRYWGDLSSGLDGFGLVGSVAVDADGGIWVSDAGNSRIMHFTLPEQ